MKSKDIQKVVKIKYENGDGPSKIYRDLAGAVSLPTIKLWIKMINPTGSITLSSPPGCPRTVRTKAAIMKVKSRLNKKKRVSTRKLANDINISRTSIRRILREDLGFILENGTMDAEVYINEVLPIALECGDKMLGDDCTYQQDGARPHTHNLTQEWCAMHFPDFIPETRWPPNSPDLCPLDYSL
ncbi:unnamed protein product [Rotaria socialis]|uniref:Transposase n=1 Tax=Rotaria socialis TaxID=392032 RepID=A0A818ECD8_9BILA|nr:unnamed protein product [Rotaria socialis]